MVNIFRRRRPAETETPVQQDEPTVIKIDYSSLKPEQEPEDSAPEPPPPAPEPEPPAPEQEEEHVPIDHERTLHAETLAVLVGEIDRIGERCAMLIAALHATQAEVGRLAMDKTRLEEEVARLNTELVAANQRREEEQSRVGHGIQALAIRLSKLRNTVAPPQRQPEE